MTPQESQLNKLKVLLKGLVPTNSFYSRRLGEAGINESIGSLEEFTQRMPFTYKLELIDDQAEAPPYGSNLTYPLNDYTRFSQTSATKGKPLIWLDTQEGWEWMLGNWAIVYEKAGVKPGDSMYFAFSFGPFLGFWTAFDSATRFGCLSIPGGGLSSVARITAIVQQGVKFLCCTPTYALYLAEVASAENIDLNASAVETIIVAGEPGGSLSHVCDRIAERWNGAHLFDHYGMTEVGPVAYQDPDRQDIMRIIEDSYFVEVVNSQSGEPVSAGEVGELVLTTLGRLGSPLLRYRTGDLVKPIEIEDKGKISLALEKGILGRSDDMIVVRGVNLYPSAVDNVVKSCSGIAEYRVLVNRNQSLIEVSLEVELESDMSNDETAHKLESALNSVFSLRIPVTILERGSLPRFEMKAQRWLDPDPDNQKGR